VGAAPARVAVGDRTWALHALGVAGALPGAALELASPVVDRLRRVKSAAEIEELALAGLALAMSMILLKPLTRAASSLRASHRWRLVGAGVRRNARDLSAAATAQTLGQMIRAGRFCINLLHGGLDVHMAPFAESCARDQRFAQPGWRHNGPVWYIDGAPASIFCDIREQVSYGTHDLLVGEVYDLIATGEVDILGWANGGLGRFAPLAPQAA